MSDAMQVPVATLRRVCGDDDGVIQRLIQSRQIAAKSGKVPLVAGVRAYLDHIRAEARNSSLAAARQEAQEARAEAVELDLDTDEGRLIDDDAAQVAVADLCGHILRVFHSIPARVTRDLHQRRAIEAALHEAQTALAQTFTGAGDKPKRKITKGGKQ
jgi:phage terminase Nu1 subunit (DNA packaging protein)